MVPITTIMAGVTGSGQTGAALAAKSAANSTPNSCPTLGRLGQGGLLGLLRLPRRSGRPSSRWPHGRSCRRPARVRRRCRGPACRAGPGACRPRTGRTDIRRDVALNSTSPTPMAWPLPGEPDQPSQKPMIWLRRRGRGSPASPGRRQNGRRRTRGRARCPVRRRYGPCRMRRRPG